MTRPPSDSSSPVYADLTPAVVLDALDSVGLRGDCRILQLNSYENRVFQVFLEDRSAVVAKFYRPQRWSDEQILEEHAFGIELAEAEIPVVAPLVLTADDRAGLLGGLAGDPPTLARTTAAAGGHRFAVTPRRAGRAPELENPETLQWIGRFIGRMHAIGSTRSFEHRQTLTVASMGRAARDWLIDNDIIPPGAHNAWRDACDAALDAAQRIVDDTGPAAMIRLHGDCHPGNLLWTDAGPHFVDLDDACNGPAVQDLWMLLSGNVDAMRSQLGELLAGYCDFMPFDMQQRRLIEPLRTIRMIHHSAWIARRWNDPAFPIAFPWFEGAAYWQQQAQQLRDQLEAMREWLEI